jgi:peptidoglycan/xylan/chitin deacetylase (PgdA/CDA1 family)
VIARRVALVGAGIGAAAVGAAALNAAPSLVALSAVGRRLSPSLSGVGRPAHVALTFDDGPDPASTPEFLDALDGLGWHATFFMLGEMVRRAPGLAEEVAAAGHEVAVHGDAHRTQLRRGPHATRDDIARARDSIVEATGREPVWFRPPFGTLSVTGWRSARALGLRTVLWTAWGRDWRADATGDSVRADVLDGLVDGGTVLLHDSDCTSAPESWRSSLAALPLLAKEFAERGLEVGTVSDHDVSAITARR